MHEPMKTDAIEDCIDYFMEQNGLESCGGKSQLAALLAALKQEEAENASLRAERDAADKEVKRLGNLLRDKCSDAEECPLFYSEKNYRDAIAEAEKWKRGYDDGCEIITRLRAEVAEKTERIVELERDGCMRRDAIAAAEERGWNWAVDVCNACPGVPPKGDKLLLDHSFSDVKEYYVERAKAAEAKEQGK
jgi:hypothetical protein